MACGRPSVAPNPQDFSKTNDLADWSHWIRLGLVDEVVVQIYRNNPERLAWGLAQPKQTAELRKELALAKQQGLNGVDLFF